jgi:uncharacterized membrane protein YdjX (TVP38/TMEM64 family)
VEPILISTIYPPQQRKKNRQSVFALHLTAGYSGDNPRVLYLAGNAFSSALGSSMNQRMFLGIFLAIGSLAGLALVFMLDGQLGPEQVRTALRAAEASPMTPVFFLGAFVVSGIIVVPIAVVLLAVGLVYGPSGFPLAWSGLMLAAVTGYFLGWRLGPREVHSQLDSAEGSRFKRLIQRNTFLAAIVGRVVPALPFAMQNVVFGSSRAPLGRFLMGSTFGVAALAVFYLILGTAGKALIPKFDAALEYGWVAPMLGLTASGWLLWDPRKKAESPPAGPLP